MVIKEIEMFLCVKKANVITLFFGSNSSFFFFKNFVDPEERFFVLLFSTVSTSEAYVFVHVIGSAREVGRTNN